MTSTAEGTQGLQRDAELSFSSTFKCVLDLKSTFRALTFVLA